MLLGGVVLIFVIQEIVPLISVLSKKILQGQKPDSRLMALLDEVRHIFEKAGIIKLSVFARKLSQAYCIPFPVPLAGLYGLFAPVLVVSDGLVNALNEQELEGVVAHETAHFYYGGNLRLVGIWIARAFQAFNPISLILFRELVEARELACDALAARATKKPKVLASALLKFNVTSPSGDSEPEADGNRFQDARERLRERSEQEAMQTRYKALMKTGFSGAPMPVLMHWLFGLTLGGLLWAIA